MSFEIPRYEINRKIRKILVSHNADMTKINYSFVNKTVYIYGNLVRESQGEYNFSTMEIIIRELSRLPRVHKVQFELDNWLISNEPGSLNIAKKGTVDVHQRRG